jgi:hypothetical protein
VRSFALIFILNLIAINFSSAEEPVQSPQALFVNNQAERALERELRELVSSFIKLPELIESVNKLENCDDLVRPTELKKTQNFIVVGISGLGTKREGQGQSSGAHNNLPVDNSITSTYRMTHKMNKKEMAEVLSNFDCPSGRSSDTDPKLIIMTNSWGTSPGSKLAKGYKKKCGEEVDLFVIVDGIKRFGPLPFTKTPVAKRCINYFQNKSTLHGSPIKNCDNRDLSEICNQKDLYACHINVEWRGTEFGRGEILDYIKTSNP